MCPTLCICYFINLTSFHETRITLQEQGKNLRERMTTSANVHTALLKELLCMLTGFVLQTTLKVRYHSTDKETEAQKGESTCPRLQQISGRGRIKTQAFVCLFGLISPPSLTSSLELSSGCHSVKGFPLGGGQGSLQRGRPVSPPPLVSIRLDSSPSTALCRGMFHVSGRGSALSVASPRV